MIKIEDLGYEEHLFTDNIEDLYALNLFCTNWDNKLTKLDNQYYRLNKIYNAILLVKNVENY